MSAPLAWFLRRMLGRRGGTLPPHRPDPGERMAVLSPGVAHLPENAPEEMRRLAEKMGYQIREHDV